MPKYTVESLKEAGIVSIREVLMDKIANGEHVCKLESGDPEFNIPHDVGHALIQAIQNRKTHYVPTAGIVSLRQAIGRKLKKENLQLKRR